MSDEDTFLLLLLLLLLLLQWRYSARYRIMGAQGGVTRQGVVLT